jgi:hypothetical protein
MVPNHALIHLGLLYGQDDFQRALMITNTAGWDTDCNSGNVGCLLGIKNGLAGIEAGPDWRGPVADRLFLPTADGGRAISDAVTEAYHVINIGRALAGQAPLAPKGGARFHFELPGSVQGWMADMSVESRGTLAIENVAGHSERGARSLALHVRGLAPGRVARAATATFVPPEAKDMPGYTLLAAPTLYPGQTLRARVEADAANTGPLAVQLYVQVYGAGDLLERLAGPEAAVQPGAAHVFSWRIPELGGRPIAQVGLEIRRAGGPSSGTLYLDELSWEGAPDVAFARPQSGGAMWRRAWVDGVDQYQGSGEETFRLVQNEGVGLLITGTREWDDYRFEARVTPHMAVSCGIAARVQGMRRYYALLLAQAASGERVARLVRALDGDELLVEAPLAWELGRPYQLSLEVAGRRLRAAVDGRVVADVEDAARPLDGGGVALLCEEGRAAFEGVAVRPLRS